MRYSNVCPYVLFFLLTIFALNASATNIDPSNNGSRFIWGVNVGWIDLVPSQGSGVTVSGTALTGMAWGENVGWIDLAPVGGGVTNDGNGKLSGSAWSENAGWIDFNPAGGGVSINACGEFDGSAWGENAGWILFRSDTPTPFKVVTSWLSRLDTVPPVTIYTPSLLPRYSANVLFHFSASDCGSGVKEIRYQLNSTAEIVTAGAAAQANVALEGCNTLSYHAVDSAGNAETARQLNVCIDKTPPVITVPATINAMATSLNGAAVNYNATATDALDGSVTPACLPASGSTFPLGSTTVACSATDQAGNSATKSFFITVVPPVFFATGDMADARNFHTATLLLNGKVLITGGSNHVTELNSADLYDPATGVFTPVGTMSEGRIGHTATLLPNGQVLIVGGFNSINRELDSAELYDPATGLFTPLGTMATARHYHSATLLPNGTVLITGGLDKSHTAQNSAALYNPSTKSFISTGAMTLARFNHTATLLANGTVLIVGGGNGKVAELFDPAKGSFSTTGSTFSERNWHSATLLPNGKVLVTGGVEGVTPSNSAELYDPSAGTFSNTGSMSAGRVFHSSSLLPNGKVLITGGGYSFANIDSAELYDPDIGKFSATAGNMRTARSAHTATLLPDGRVLLTGGWNNIYLVKSAELYDPTGGSFNAGGTMNSSRCLHTATLLPDGKVLIAGGYDRNINPSAPPLVSAELYDPDSNTSSPIANMTDYHDGQATLLPDGRVLFTKNGHRAELYDPVNRSFISVGYMAYTRILRHTATLLPNGKVLITGGDRNLAELYDPVNNTFSPTGSMPVTRVSNAATLLPNGTVLITGGYGGGDYLIAYLYDPTSGTFSPTGKMSVSRENHTSTLLPNGKVLLTGGDVVGNSAELYDPVSGTFSPTGSMSTARAEHSATLLPNGKVLVIGGSYSSSAELYNPADGTFSSAGSMTETRIQNTATLLPSGKVLIAGGWYNNYLNSTELYDTALGFSENRRPVITRATFSGAKLSITGSGFRGDSEASGGNTQNSATNYPLVQLRRLDNGQSTFLLSDPLINWTDTSFTSQAVPGLVAGFYQVTVFTNGIPSQAFIINPFPPPAISGSMPTTAKVGFPYSFTPTAANVTNFSITGTLPPGLTFNTATGTLSGTPTLAGSYGGIIISAINSAGSASLPASTITVLAAWQSINTGLSTYRRFISALAIDPLTPQTLYAGSGVIGGGISKTTDGGDTWIELTLPAKFGSGFDIKALAIDPINPLNIYAGSGSDGVYKSTNGGGSWTLANTGLGTSIHVFSLAIDPATPQTLYVGNIEQSNGGVFKSLDSAGTWTRSIGNGVNGVLLSNSVNALAVDPVQPQTVYAGANHGLYKTIDGGGHWIGDTTGTFTGGLAGLAIDPFDPRIVYAALGGLGIARSTDGGNTWNMINVGLNTPSTSVTAVAVVPNDHVTLYAATSKGVYVSTNSGGTWTVDNDGLPAFALNAQALAIDVTDPPAIYVGTQGGGGVYKKQRLTGTLPTISGTPAGTATIGVPYSFVPSATNATGFRINGTIPPGLTFNATTGKLSGTPTAAGSYNNIIISATNVAGVAWLPAYSLTVVMPPPTISGTPATTGIVGTDYNFIPAATNPGSFSMSGPCPPGLTFNTATGVLSGTPTAAGVYHNLKISVSNTGGVASLPSFTLTIAPQITTIGGTPPTTATVGTPYSFTPLTGTTVSFTSTGVLPPGLTLDPATGTLSGTPTTVGVYSDIRITASNANGSASLPLFAITVTAATPAWPKINNGNVFSLAIDPNDRQTVYAGTYSGGGILKTTDGGGSWILLNNGLTATNINTLAIDPTGIIYAGSTAGGVFKSSDGGNLWQAINNGLTIPYVAALAIDPSNPLIIYAGTSTGGVYKTGNGGTSWSRISSGMTVSGSTTIPMVYCLAIDPATPQTVYAGTGSGIYKTINGGSTWSPINNGLVGTGVNSLAIDPFNSQNVYAGTGGVFKSTNGGGSWSLSTSGVTNGPFYALVIDPHDSRTVYAGSYSGGIFKTTDSGVSWTYLPTGPALAPFIVSLAIDPIIPRTLYAGSQGSGLFKLLFSPSAPTISGTAPPAYTGSPYTFTPASTNAAGFSITGTIPPGLVFSPATGTLSGAPSAAGAYSSIQITAFNNLGSAVLPPFTLTVNAPLATISGNPDLSAFVGISYSFTPVAANATGFSITGALPPGLTFDATTGILSGVPTTAGTYSTIVISAVNAANISASLPAFTITVADVLTIWQQVGTGLTITDVQAVAIDPTAPQTVYAAGAGGVYKSINGGSSWSYSGYSTKVIIRSLVIDPGNPGTIYAGSYGSGVFKSINNGGTWFESNVGLTNLNINSLVIDPTNTQIIYAGTDFGGVFKSMDGGGSWFPANFGLTGTRIYSLAIDPTNSLTVYVGIYEGGVFKSIDGGGSWSQLASGLPNIYVYALALDSISPQSLYAGITGDLAKSVAGGAWIASHNGLTVTINYALTTPTVIALAIDPTNPRTLYAGTSGYGVFKSVDSGVTWTRISIGLYTTNAGINSLAIDPGNPQTVYAGTGGYGVYKILSVPVITGTPAAPATVGIPFSFTPTIVNNAASFSIKGSVPPGLTLNTTTGTLSGIPTAIGTFSNIQIIATNSKGSASMAPFSITVNPPAPKISGIPSAIVTVGVPYRFTPSVTYPGTFSLTGTLPPGLAFDVATGTLSGIPTTAGVYGNLQISATTPGGSASLPAFSITVSPVYNTLSVVLSGTDPGIISSVTPGIDFNCPGNCFRSYPAGTTITLKANPSSISYFSGWSGACTNSSGDCQILLDSGKTVKAAFSTLPAIRILVGNSPNYVNPVTLQNAYNTAPAGATIQLMSNAAVGPLDAGANKVIRLKGGYDSSYVVQSGRTVISGPLVIRSGTVSVHSVAIR